MIPQVAIGHAAGEVRTASPIEILCTILLFAGVLYVLARLLPDTF